MKRTLIMVTMISVALAGCKSGIGFVPSSTGFHEFKAAVGTSVSESQFEWAPPTGVNCGSNECRFSTPSGCAFCTTLEVPIPLKATIVKVHCYTSAGYPNDSAPPHEVACTADNSWSVFDAPTTETRAWTQIVRTTYHNRSSDRLRLVKMIVEWQ
jgi:hypothetical protein